MLFCPTSRVRRENQNYLGVRNSIEFDAPAAPRISKKSSACRFLAKLQTPQRSLQPTANYGGYKWALEGRKRLQSEMRWLGMAIQACEGPKLCRIGG